MFEIIDGLGITLGARLWEGLLSPWVTWEEGTNKRFGHRLGRKAVSSHCSPEERFKLRVCNFQGKIKGVNNSKVTY